MAARGRTDRTFGARSARLSGTEGWHLVRLLRLSVVRDLTASGVVFFFALSAYLLLGQSTFYKGDGQAFVAALSTGDFEHPYHLLYPRLLQGFASLLGGMDISHLRIGTALSAVGAAIGVAVFHATCRTGIGPCARCSPQHCRHRAADRLLCGGRRGARTVPRLRVARVVDDLTARASCFDRQAVAVVSRRRRLQRTPPDISWSGSRRSVLASRPTAPRVR